ncbi:dihydroorotase [Terasakiispira papahanaumokuakeensis]|uniref:Dihydroorotase n=1 Tax=Terasakiispira papahanaumokuakeensis TaxID=197479 RepID=A0A1E2VEZ8_9GAMM|nr:dihydroorotase [Terasakiispira papahanaumokuakeensis]ODC05543.1 dihydroorotase [Terasakiispira papahanaumokuakeensis]
MSATPDMLTIRRPDDWHLHLRDGEALKTVLPYTSQTFARAIIMPNLMPPITTLEMAQDYRQRILAATPEAHDFTPLMTCYLNESVTQETLKIGHADGLLTAAKLYPANATTNSQHGVKQIQDVYPLLETMQAIGMPLLIHGEVTRGEVDIFDREKYFIDEVMLDIRRQFPALKIVFEHITTKEAAQLVLEGDDYLGATLTPQHLAQNRNDMLVGGIRPHLYCLPVLKRSEHQRALRQAATSGHPRFFLGTDSAPHVAAAKECGCGCAGVFNTSAALSVYAEVFEQENALAHFEAFCSENGPNFYGLPLNEGQVTLTRTPSTMPERIGQGEMSFVPYKAGETLSWTVS